MANGRILSSPEESRNGTSLALLQKNPRDLARYVTTPRLIQVKFGRQHLASTPTALDVAMGPEYLWRSQEPRSKENEKIQAATR